METKLEKEKRLKAERDAKITPLQSAIDEIKESCDKKDKKWKKGEKQKEELSELSELCNDVKKPEVETRLLLEENRRLPKEYDSLSHIVPPDSLNPKEVMLIEKYCSGKSIKDAEIESGYDGHGNALSRVLKSLSGTNYYNEVMARMRERSFCNRESLEVELLTRLENADDKTAVQIINTLMKLNGLGKDDDKTEVKIEFNWTQDPWKD